MGQDKTRHTGLRGAWVQHRSRCPHCRGSFRGLACRASHSSIPMSDCDGLVVFLVLKKPWLCCGIVMDEIGVVGEEATKLLV